MAEVHHFTAADLIVQPSDLARREKAKEANVANVEGGKDEARNSGEDNSGRKPGDAHAHG
jgi:hypothetical protein